MTVDTAQPNYPNICTALELLTFLLSILKKEIILSSLKPLQRGISACMTCTNTKVFLPAWHVLGLKSVFCCNRKAYIYFCQKILLVLKNK